MNTPKHICITGCTRGLGRALVAWFTAHGWTVSGCGRNPDSIAEIRKAYPENRGLFLAVDVTDDTAVAGFAQAVKKEAGAPDLLVNNAAVINPVGPLWEIPAEAFNQVTSTNINGVANCLRHFTPLFIEAGAGIMINLSSGWGRSTSPDVAPYCASKWAIEGLSQAMAQELPRGIAVAAMNPGIIDTDMLREAFGSGAGHYPTAEEWAQTAGPFLAGLDASVNGKQLTVS